MLITKSYISTAIDDEGARRIRNVIKRVVTDERADNSNKKQGPELCGCDGSDSPGGGRRGVLLLSADSRNRFMTNSLALAKLNRSRFSWAARCRTMTVMF